MSEVARPNRYESFPEIRDALTRKEHGFGYLFSLLCSSQVPIGRSPGSSLSFAAFLLLCFVTVWLARV